MTSLKDTVITYTNTSDIKHLIQLVKDSSMNAITATNDENEDVFVSIVDNSLEIRTYQNNHWVRVHYYNLTTGLFEGETFDGRW